MYEAILHCISTRLTLFNLSSSKSYNSRSISTLAVESFFSDLSKFEFGGLGAPKAVDIPKLISHVVFQIQQKMIQRVDLNSQPAPETIILYISWNILKIIPIQMNLRIIRLISTGISKTKRLKNNWFTLSKPKQVAKGGHGIRQYFKIDETELTAKKRLGKNLDANEYSL